MAKTPLQKLGEKLLKDKEIKPCFSLYYVLEHPPTISFLFYTLEEATTAWLRSRFKSEQN